MYFDYVGLKGDKLYGILNVTCDEKGFNKNNYHVKIIKFWGNREKISYKTEISSYYTITEIIEKKENLGYDGLTHNLIEKYDIFSKPVKDKLSKRYMWEKLKD